MVARAHNQRSLHRPAGTRQGLHAIQLPDPQWTPLQLPGLFEWWDADAGLTLREDGGNTFVTAWEGRHAGLVLAQETEADQPIVASSVNFGGKEVLQFDGTQYLWGEHTPPPAFPISFLAVALHDDDSGTSTSVMVSINHSDTTIRHLQLNRSNANIQARSIRGSSGNAVVTTAGVDYRDGEAHAFAASLDEEYREIWVDGAGNGATDTGSTTIPSPLSRIAIGAYASNSPNQFMKGQIAEVAITRQQLSAADLNQWLAYVEAKYGIAYTEVS